MFERCERWIASILSLLVARRGRPAAVVCRATCALGLPSPRADLEPAWVPAMARPLPDMQIPTCGSSSYEMPRSVFARHDGHIVHATGVSPLRSIGSVRCRAFAARRGLVRLLPPGAMEPSHGPPYVR